MTTLRHDLPQLAIAAVIVLFFSDFVVMSYEVLPLFGVWVATPLTVTVVALLASRSVHLGAQVLLWAVVVVAAVQLVAVLLAPSSLVGPSDLLLVLIYLGCAVLGGLLGVVALMASIAGRVFGSSPDVPETKTF